MKSTSAWDFTAVRGTYFKLCGPSSIAHLAIRPVTSRFWIISPKGAELTTVMGCPWKYCFSFRLAMKTPYTSFCQCGYLFLEYLTDIVNRTLNRMLLTCLLPLYHNS